MRKIKAVIAFFTAVFLIFSVAVIAYSIKATEIIPFYITVYANEQTERIDCWKNEENEYFVFLPSYSKLSEVRIYSNTESDVSINSKTLIDGMYCTDFELETPYDLVFTDFGKICKYTVTFIKSAKVPTMYIDTESGNMEYIQSNKGNEESGNISLYTDEGKIDYIGNLESIKGRGNSTWLYYEKKPYNLKLSIEADLLEMGEAREWILLANYADSSNLRNKIVYDFAKDVGLEYSPDSEWVDLYLNGEYAGLYLLTESNEIHRQRVNINSKGSFLVSLEYEYKLKEQNYTYITVGSGQALRVHSVSNDLKTLEEKWQSVENAILSSDSIDNITGKNLLELIDLDSWAKKYLIEEVFGNFDACFVSQFFYCNGEDGKIYAGPVWDYDLSLGRSATYQINNPKSFIANRQYALEGYETPWFYTLYSKDFFYERVIELYKTEFLPELKNLLDNKITSYTNKISKASYMNTLRWFDEEDDLSKQCDYIVDYMNQRIDFLSNIWECNREYYTVTIDHGNGSYYSYYCVYPGENLPYLPVLTDSELSECIGWYYTDTDEPFDITRPIYEDTAIYAKWQDTAKNKIDKIFKLIPLAVIAVIFIVLFVIEIKRMKGNR